MNPPARRHHPESTKVRPSMGINCDEIDSVAAVGLMSFVQPVPFHQRRPGRSDGSSYHPGGGSGVGESDEDRSTTDATNAIVTVAETG